MVLALERRWLPFSRSPTLPLLLVAERGRVGEKGSRKEEEKRAACNPSGLLTMIGACSL